MPFAWIFTEAEGFSGSRRGLRSRVQETCVVLLLLVVITFGLAFVALAIFADDDAAKASLFDAWEYHFPRLYSFVSLVGVLLLLICTPLGFARIFTVVGQLLVKPRFLKDLDQEISIARLEEEALLRKSRQKSENDDQQRWTPPSPVSNDYDYLVPKRYNAAPSYSPPPPQRPRSLGASPNNEDGFSRYYHQIRNGDRWRPVTAARSWDALHGAVYASDRGVDDTRANGFGVGSGWLPSPPKREFGLGSGDAAIYSAPPPSTPRFTFSPPRAAASILLEHPGSTDDGEDVDVKLDRVRQERLRLENQRRKPRWQRHLGYPVIMLSLMAVTGISFLMVVENVIELSMGYTALPGDGATLLHLGQSSYSAFGSVGSVLQVVVIFYMMAASIVGLHSAPCVRAIVPRPHDTPLTAVIANVTLILVLSSAQPLLVKTLGLTNFDLLGDYREIRWLHHFYIVLLYNLLFASATAWCLLRKITGPVRQELCRRFASVLTPSATGVYGDSAKWLSLLPLPFPLLNAKEKEV